MDNQKILLSKKQGAEMLSISLRTVEKLIAGKRLAVTRIGKRVLISRKALEQFARE